MKQFARRPRKQASGLKSNGISEQDQLVAPRQARPNSDPFVFPDDEEPALATLAAASKGTCSTFNKEPAAAQQTVAVGIPGKPAASAPEARAQQQAIKSTFDFGSQESDSSPAKRARVAAPNSSQPRELCPQATTTAAARRQQSEPVNPPRTHNSQSHTSKAAVKVAGSGDKQQTADTTFSTIPAPTAAAAVLGIKRRTASFEPPRLTAVHTAAPKEAVAGLKEAAAAGSGRAPSSGAASGINRRPPGLASRSAGSGRAAAAGSGLGRAASGGGRAASSGRAAGSARRSASGSGRRSKSISPDLTAAVTSVGGPGTPAGSQEQQAAGASKTGQSGIRTPAVSLPTPRRPVGLIAAAGLLAAAEGRPAQTVMEAQERGELVQLQDDARYAMDGLAAECSIDTQRESAVALTEMLCSRRGRMALRADGLAQQVVSCLAKLKACKDCVMGLAATIVLLMLTSEDAHPAYLASVAAAVLMDQLLQCNHSLAAVSSCGASGAKLAKLLKARPLCTLLASTGVSTQRELLLITLEQATSSQQTSKVAAVERLKHNLRQYGVLQRLGKLVAAAASDAVQEARQLHLLLLVLENATFTCQQNGQTLVSLQVAVGNTDNAAAGLKDEVAGHSSQADKPTQPFPAVLVSAAQQLLGSLAGGQCQEALHVCLAVLMNLSHQNPEGAAVISEAGGLQAAAATIQQLLGPLQHEVHQVLCKQVLQHLELISVALGVLINLVSGEPSNSRKLASLGAAAPAVESCGASSSTDCEEPSQLQLPGLVPLLCAVMTAVGRLLEQQQEALQAEEEQGGNRHGGSRGAANRAQAMTGRGTSIGAVGVLGSPTGSGSLGGPGSGMGLDSSSASEASIVEVYCGMLLGFLVRDCADIADAVAQQLEGHSLQPIVCAVQRCLSFYVSTGAITEHTRTTLEELLQHLSGCAHGGLTVTPAGVACT